MIHPGASIVSTAFVNEREGAALAAGCSRRTRSWKTNEKMRHKNLKKIYQRIKMELRQFKTRRQLLQRKCRFKMKLFGRLSIFTWLAPVVAMKRERMKHSWLPSRDIDCTWKILKQFRSSIGRLRQRKVYKSVRHVQHDCLSSFDQSYHSFVAFLLPLPSSFLKPYNRDLRCDGSEKVAQNCKFGFVNLFRHYLSLCNFWKLAGLLRNWI